MTTRLPKGTTILIRTLAPLLVAGLIKYLTSKILMDVIADILEEALENKERARRNNETTQSES